MTHKAIISASILSADFANLGRDTRAVLDAGITNIHFDVMDHHFVPNLSFGAVVCKALRQDDITAPIDVHLMVTDPEHYFEPFAKAGANLITFHPETVANVDAALNQLDTLKLQAGLAFNPEAPVDISDEQLKRLDLILLMSVNPGFAGQSFMDGSLEKISALRERITQLGAKTKIGIDGGIKASNIGTVVKAGADFIIVGSGMFNADDYSVRAQELFHEIDNA